jgi:hypothetical protein
MTDQWTDRLSEYLDGTLPRETFSALELHLQDCLACRADIEELRRVVLRAHAAVDTPAGDLWPVIAARIGAAGAPVASLAAHRARTRVSLTVPQLAAAAALLIALSGGATWLALRPGAGSGVAAQPPRLFGAQVVQAGFPDKAQLSYDAAVTDLDRALVAGRSRLSPKTVAVLEKNLTRIDAAMAEARAALATDPANAYLSSHLATTMRQKLALLQQATTLADAAS